MQKVLSNKYIWIAVALLLSVLTSNAVICLVIGMVFALIFGNPIASVTGRVSEKLLKTAVVLMGFGMSIGTMLKVGYASLWITFSSILITMVLGILYGRLFGTDRQIAVLVSSGTAICGASAIATMSPAIGATQAHTAIALAVVFILNALGLLIFPFLGHLLNLSPETFGLWAAISIHNTSSVVGGCGCCNWCYSKTCTGIMDISTCFYWFKTDKIRYKTTSAVVFTGIFSSRYYYKYTARI